ncbi:hypothetical protein HYW20_06085 [Candidatus Woesearchaeota archaeon]|nr:hypothetical protein [Candidatus Woesearchaeota archaeon]
METLHYKNLNLNPQYLNTNKIIPLFDFLTEKWNTGRIDLKGVQESVRLPENVRVKYTDDYDRGYWLARRGGNLFVNKHGELRPTHNPETGTLDFLIDTYKGDGPHFIFTRGHEEGHLLDVTGNLVTLWNAAASLGYNFECFPFSLASKSDFATICLYEDKGFVDEREKSEFVRLSFEKDFNQKELIAHIGGLVALAKSRESPSLIKKIADSIRTDSEYEVRGVLKEI